MRPYKETFEAKDDEAARKRVEAFVTLHSTRDRKAGNVFKRPESVLLVERLDRVIELSDTLHSLVTAARNEKLLLRKMEIEHMTSEDVR